MTPEDLEYRLEEIATVSAGHTLRLRLLNLGNVMDFEADRADWYGSGGGLYRRVIKTINELEDAGQKVDAKKLERMMSDLEWSKYEKDKNTANGTRIHEDIVNMVLAFRALLDSYWTKETDDFIDRLSRAVDTAREKHGLDSLHDRPS